MKAPIGYQRFKHNPWFGAWFQGSSVPPVMTMALMTRVPVGAAVTTTITLVDTFYAIENAVSATEGDVLGDLTDNNDLSITNSSSENKRIYGIIEVEGNSATSRRYKVGVGNNNSGSLVELASDFGDLQNDGSTTYAPHMIAYSMVLNAGKTVTPMVMNYTSNANFDLRNASHYVWSFD